MKKTMFFGLMAFLVGCGSSVLYTDPNASLVCKFPEKSSIISYLELEGTCGPQKDTLFNPKDEIGSSCVRKANLNLETCDYTMSEKCDSDCGGGDGLSVTNDKYDMNFMGYGDHTGYLERTVTANGVVVCSSKYLLTIHQ
jgi:hypothetical protein